MTGEELEAIRGTLGLPNQADLAEFIACDVVGYRRYATNARTIPRYVARSAELLLFIHQQGLLERLQATLQEAPAAASTQGYWREPLPGLQAGDTLVWKAPGRLGLQVWQGQLHGKTVARINRQPANGKGCTGKLDGWVWTDQEEGSAAERMGVKESEFRGFTSVSEAKRAIEAAIAAVAQPNAQAASRG